MVRPGDFPLAELLEQEGCSGDGVPGCRAGHGRQPGPRRGVTRDAGGWIVALADMPRIRPDTIRRVAQALDGRRRHRRAGVSGRPRPSGRRSAARFLHELQVLIGDSGARAVVQRNQALVRLIECDDPGILLDIDRRSDLTRSA